MLESLAWLHRRLVGQMMDRKVREKPKKPQLAKASGAIGQSTSCKAEK